MPKFEILIPKSAKVPMDLRLQLEAESWIEALKIGRRKMGEKTNVTENILCDIKEDNSIHVTDAGTGQVFRIMELLDQAPPPREVPKQAAPPPAPPSRPSKPAAAPPPPPKTASAPPPAPAPARPIPKAPPSSPIGRSLDFTSESTADLLEETFEFSQKVHEKPDRTEAAYFMLDLAMNKIQADSGSVLIADINGNELTFEAARGPKAKEVMKFRIKIGQGLVGFCAAEAVGLAVSDVTRDPRFFSAISEKIGYPTRSILCVPMLVEGRVMGAIELINKRGSDIFTERDINVANFIAHQLGEYLLCRLA